jgi:hypothetical protein
MMRSEVCEDTYFGDKKSNLEIAFFMNAQRYPRVLSF